MSLIQEITRIADDHPRIVIATLLGVLVVGGTGGSIWISNLQSNLAENQKVVEERMNLTEQRYSNAIAALRQKDVVLSRQVEQLHTEIPALISSINTIDSKFEKFPPPQASDSSDWKEFRVSVDSLHARSRAIQAALDRTDAVAKASEDIFQIQMGGGAESSSDPTIFRFILVMAMIFAGIGFVLGGLLSRKRHS
jgi:hypothetical protein